MSSAWVAGRDLDKELDGNSPEREREREEQQRKIVMGNVFIQSMSNS
jgi:hypothetical protein